MGLGVAKSLLLRGGRVTLVARNAERLAAAKKELEEGGLPAASIATAAVDGASEEAVKGFFESLEEGSVHHLVATVSAVVGETMPFKKAGPAGLTLSCLDSSD